LLVTLLSADSNVCGHLSHLKLNLLWLEIAIACVSIPLLPAIKHANFFLSGHEASDRSYSTNLFRFIFSSVLVFVELFF
jgi:hypothetical protein